MVDSWNTQPLGELVDLKYGKGLTAKDRIEGDYPVVGSGGIVGYHNQYLVEGPGIVIGRKGSIGTVYFIRNNFFPIDTVFYVTLKSQQTNLRFLYYLLLQLNLPHLNSDAAVPGLNRTVALREKCRFPAPSDQRKIAAILSAYDDLIEYNERQIKVLEEMTRLIFCEWFVYFRFSGHEQTKMIDSQLGKVPTGWDVKPLGQIVLDIIDYRGKTPKKLGSEWSQDGIMALSALNVKQGRLVNLDKSKFVSEELYNKWMKSKLQTGDILLTSEAPLGELYFLVRRTRFCLSQRLFSIRPNPEIIKPVILYQSLASPIIQQELRARATGATVQGIRQALLREVPILVPPISIQVQAAPLLDSLAEQIEVIEAMNANLRCTKNLLLPKLIAGDVDVSELTIHNGNEVLN